MRLQLVASAAVLFTLSFSSSWAIAQCPGVGIPPEESGLDYGCYYGACFDDPHEVCEVHVCVIYPNCGTSRCASCLPDEIDCGAFTCCMDWYCPP